MEYIDGHWYMDPPEVGSEAARYFPTELEFYRPEDPQKHMPAYMRGYEAPKGTPTRSPKKIAARQPVKRADIPPHMQGYVYG